MKKILMMFIIVILLTTLLDAEGFITYIVKQGDSLSRIAKRFNVSLDELINLNEFRDPDLIIVNQRIKIPETDQENFYKVKRGDTLCEIAARFAVKVSELVRLNNLKSADRIYVGQHILLSESVNRERYQISSRSEKLNYIWPVQGKISSYYGWRQHPIKKERIFHSGIDIGVEYGTPVYASETGIVEFCGWSEGYGNLVIIRHRDNSRTYYGHNLELLVKKGDNVKQGKIIALSGNSGLSTGPHLHFEIRINNKPIDPLLYLNSKYLKNNFRV